LTRRVIRRKTFAQPRSTFPAAVVCGRSLPPRRRHRARRRALSPSTGHAIG
jgi:hypothetical protein